MSKVLVASSSRRMRGFLRTALAMAIFTFLSSEKYNLLSPTYSTQIPENAVK
jgi:hypothetical protein